MTHVPSIGAKSGPSREVAWRAYFFAGVLISLSLAACSPSPTENQAASNFFHLEGDVRYADGTVPEAVVVHVLSRRESCGEMTGPPYLDTGFLLDPLESGGTFARDVETILTRWREEICVMLVAETKAGVRPVAGPDTVAPRNVIVSAQPPQDSITVSFVLEPTY